MKLQIKSLSGQIPEEEKRYLRKRLLWLEKHLPNNALLIVGIREHITKKSNQAHEVILHLTSPNIKKAVYTKVFANSFMEAVDRARAKVERIILKRKEKSARFKLKMPRIKLPSKRL